LFQGVTPSKFGGLRWSSNSEHEESGKSGGEDSSESDGEESGGDESEDEPSSGGVSDDQATDRSDTESEDDEAVQTRNETGGRAQLVGQEGAVRYPADLINIDQWYLTRPTGEPGSPDTVEGEQLKTFSNDFFRLTLDRKGIVFAANAGGVIVANHPPRREQWRGRRGSRRRELRHRRADGHRRAGRRRRHEHADGAASSSTDEQKDRDERGE
jgi:hypothetical protein